MYHSKFQSKTRWFPFAVTVATLVFLAGCSRAKSPEVATKQNKNRSSDKTAEASSNNTSSSVSIPPDSSGVESGPEISDVTPNTEVTPETTVPTLPEGNQGVFDFVKRQIGKMVGNGLCQDLQDAALNATGTTLQAYQQALALNSEKILPGDIMHWAPHTNHNNYPASPSAPLKPIFPSLMMFKAVAEGHVSIVKDVVSNVELTIWHQNINNIKIVKEDRIRLDAIVSGKITFFRPEKK